MITRREFLDALAVGAAGLAMGTTAKSYAQIMGSNNRLNFAVFGLNGARGRGRLDCPGRENGGCRRRAGNQPHLKRALDLAVFAFDGTLGRGRAALTIRALVPIASAVRCLTHSQHGLLQFLHRRPHGTHVIGIQPSLDRR